MTPTEPPRGTDGRRVGGRVKQNKKGEQKAANTGGWTGEPGGEGNGQVDTAWKKCAAKRKRGRRRWRGRQDRQKPGTGSHAGGRRTQARGRTEGVLITQEKSRVKKVGATKLGSPTIAHQKAEAAHGKKTTERAGPREAERQSERDRPNTQETRSTTRRGTKERRWRRGRGRRKGTNDDRTEEERKRIGPWRVENGGGETREPGKRTTRAAARQTGGPARGARRAQEGENGGGRGRAGKTATKRNRAGWGRREREGSAGGGQRERLVCF